LTTRHRKNKVLLQIASLVILFLTILYPFFNIPILGDEAASFLMNFDYPLKTLLFSYTGPSNHNFFIIFSKICVALFGESEFSFRLPVIFAGILAIPLIYKISFQISKCIFTAFISSLLLTLSFPHLKFSTDGRGHGLSLTLGLILTIVVFNLLKKKRDFLWGVTLVVFGICFVLTVPSNVYFLASLGTYFAIQTYINRPKNSSFKNWIYDLAPFFILLFCVSAYFFIIFEDLKIGIVTAGNYHRLFHGGDNLNMSLDRIKEIFLLFVSPWGSWLYLLVLVGCFSWRKNRPIGILYLCLFVPPFILMSISGVMGPGRIYLYWLPFILILGAHGISKLTSLITQFAPSINRSCIFALFAVGLTTQPFFKFKTYYYSENKIKGALISDAIQTLNLIKKESSDFDLIVIPYKDRVLRRYLGREVSDRMLNIIKNNKIQNITFIGHKSIPPNKIPFADCQTECSWLKEKHFQKVSEIGQLSIHKLSSKINKHLSIHKDPDYESVLAFQYDAETIVGSESIAKQYTKNYLQINRQIKPHIVGKTSLKIEKSNLYKNKPMYIFSPVAKMIKTLSDDSYSLFVFATRFKFNDSSFANLVSLKQPNAPSAFLNTYQGVFLEDKEGKLFWKRVHPFSHYLANSMGKNKMDSNFYWQIHFSLSPLKKDIHQFLVGFRLMEKSSYFDGFQSYLLHP